MGQLGSSQGPLPLYIVDLGDFHQKNVKECPYFKDILNIFKDVRIENWKNIKNELEFYIWMKIIYSCVI